MTKIIAPALLVSSLLAVLLLLFAAASSSAAADFTVTRNDDPSPANCVPGDCSLRGATNAANAAIGRQVIQVTDGLEIVLSSALHISGDLTITGQGGDSSISATIGSQIIVIDGNGDAIIQDISIGAANVQVPGCGGGVYNQGTAQLLRVNIHNNSMNGQGAGICNLGTMDINQSLVINNQAVGAGGGGIYNNGTMTIESSAINGNGNTGTDAGGDGAGIENDDGGSLTIEYSTISGNTSSSPVCNDCSSGAGIRNDGTFTLNHSTVSGNHADNTAAIQNSGTGTVNNSTISGNDAGSITNETHGILTVANSTVSGNLGLPYPKQGYGGIGNYATVTVARTTVVDNTASGYEYGGFYASNNSLQIVLVGDLIANNGAQNCSNGGNIVSQGGNVISDDSCRNLGTDHVVTTDMMIGPLANNGGTTLTRALLAGSPAIDAGISFQCSFDQRGAPRPVGAACDAGSFEFGSTAPTLTPSPSPTPAPIAYPMGDADCSDHVDMNDVPAELRLVAGLDAPSDCGRSTIPCTTFDGVCYEGWTNTDCNGSVDGADVLPILMYLIDQPLTEPCTQVGQYPSHCGGTAFGIDAKSVAVC